MSDGAAPEGVTVAAAPEGTPQFSAAELASIEKGRAGFSPAPVASAPAAPQRPENVPEKFWKDGKVDTEGLLASYGELETKLGAPKEPEVVPPEPAKVDPNGKITKPAAEEAAAVNPLTELLDLARADFTGTQGFSEETVQKLVEAGIPSEIQQVYLAGLASITKESVGAIHGFVGGEQNYQAMSAWAAEKLTDGELDAFNDALDNPQLRENAVRGLYSRYQTARPSEGRQITPVNAGAAGGDVFKSKDDLVAAQKDPRYRTDSAYRESVMEKLSRSRDAGFAMQKTRLF